MNLKTFVVACTAGAWAVSVHGAVVYDNLVTDLGTYLGGFRHEEVGDDVTLAGTARVFESAEIAYLGANFDGDETLTLNLYKMDGAPTPGSFGFNTPGTSIFSETKPLSASGLATITFLDASGSVTLPDKLGIGLIFGGIDFDAAGNDAGPELFDPPTPPGSSFDDFWVRGFPNPGDPWALYTFGGNPPGNFGVQINARESTRVPDTGSTIGLLSLAVGTLTRLARRQQI